jgi:hypothetical protein
VLCSLQDHLETGTRDLDHPISCQTRLKQEGWASLKSRGKEGPCRSDLLKIAKDEVRDPTLRTPLLIPLREPKWHNAMAIQDPHLGSCAACQASQVVHHPGHLLSH